MFTAESVLTGRGGKGMTVREKFELVVRQLQMCLLRATSLQGRSMGCSVNFSRKRPGSETKRSAHCAFKCKAHSSPASLCMLRPPISDGSH